MSEKSEKAEILFRQGYNCCQAVLGAFCHDYGLSFQTAMKLASSFGGGMGRMREVCGTVSAMFMIAGLAAAENTNRADQYRMIQKLAEKFREKNGSIICRELLKGIESSTSPVPSPRSEAYYTKRPCLQYIADAVEILECQLH